MAKKLYGSFVFSAVILIVIAGPVIALADVERVYGKAFNMDGKLEYVEEHVVEYENGRIARIRTTYYGADSQKVGEQISDFSHGPNLGSYDFKDERLQYSDGAKVMSDRILIYSKRPNDSETRRKYLPREPAQIVGQGFNQFIVAKLDTLVRGDVISAKLVLPAQMGQHDVRIYKRSIQGDRILVRIDIDNWFLRLFAPHVEAEFDLNSGRVHRYRGVSMISDEAGKTIEVTTTYDYPQKPSLLSSMFGQRTPTFDRN